MARNIDDRRQTNYVIDHEPMDDDAIVAWLSLKIETGMGAADGDISNRRQKNYEYYSGRPYGDEEDGYSKVITMECFEAVEWVLPGLIRIFTATKFAEFVPQNAQDMDAAEQETDVVNDVIVGQTNMFEWAQAWMKDALIYPNGYLKVYIDEARDLRLIHHENITQAQLNVIEQDPTLVVATVEESDVELIQPVQDPQTGQVRPVQTLLYNVKARYIEPSNNIKIEAVPPEEVITDNDLRTIDMDGSEFLCHHREVTRSELVAMGIDKEDVWNLPLSRELKFSTERESRTEFHDEDPNYGEDHGAMEKVDYFECYGKLDVDGDGYAEYRRFDCVGRSLLLDHYETDYQPLVALGCFPQPHRHTAMSMVDVAKENQRVNSVMKRQILDNLYRTNRPRQFAGRGVNIEQLQNYVPHGVVEVDDINQIQTESIPVVTQQVMPFMEFIREELDRRTGVTRHAAGLDAETLASSTMGAYLESLGQATQRVEMLARNFAETGYSKVALKVHHLLRTRQNPQLTMQKGEDWIDIDPRQWNPRRRMRVKVGVGTGSVKEKLSGAIQTLETQQQVQPFGLANAKGAWNALKDMCEALGKPVPEMYYVNPDSQEYRQWVQQQEQQRKERMEMELMPQKMAGQALQQEFMEATAKVQLDAMKEKNRQAEDTAKTMLEADKNKSEEFLKAAELELKHQVDIEKVGVEADKVKSMNVGTSGGSE